MHVLLFTTLSCCFFLNPEFLPSPLTIREINSSTTLDTTMILINRTIYMFGIGAVLSTVSDSNTGSVDSRCILLFLGTNSEVVAVSNIVRFVITSCYIIYRTYISVHITYRVAMSIHVYSRVCNELQ